MKVMDEAKRLQPVRIRLTLQGSHAVSFEKINGSSVDVFRLADNQLHYWSEYLTTSRDSYQIRYEVVYEDGRVLVGRYALDMGITLPEDVLGKHLTTYLQVRAGLRKPDHMSAEVYQAMVESAQVWDRNKDVAVLVQNRALNWLNNYRTFRRQKLY